MKRVFLIAIIYFLISIAMLYANLPHILSGNFWVDGSVFLFLSGICFLIGAVISYRKLTISKYLILTGFIMWFSTVLVGAINKHGTDFIVSMYDVFWVICIIHIVLISVLFWVDITNNKIKSKAA